MDVACSQATWAVVAEVMETEISGLEMNYFFLAFVHCIEKERGMPGVGWGESPIRETKSDSASRDRSHRTLFKEENSAHSAAIETNLGMRGGKSLLEASPTA